MPMSYDSDLISLFEEIAPAVGATCDVEPLHRRAGKLQFGNGSVLFFRKNHLNVNRAGNARMAADKSFLSTFLAGMGFRTLPEVTISRFDLKRGTIDPAKRSQVSQFAAQNNWLTVVKPNAMSQGRGVRMTGDQKQLFDSILETLAVDRVCIVQQYCPMPEYRLVVLRDCLLQAYRRQPMTVVGNGFSSIEELVRTKLKTLSESRHEDFSPDLFLNISRTVNCKGRRVTDVATLGERIVVADTANLSAGGEATDVAGSLNPKWADLAVELARKCGLLLAGVDIFIDDISDGNSDYRVIELNSAPGLDDYLFQGSVQKSRVLALYQRVLETVATAAT
jgi:glutathione synthase/RimK-type ligase-like ATP-grasp enzyme